ncbi:MAG TPA: PAS domain S-box protein [Blastocatellia bacterium]|nr:PAS domain S-box protein [Blastocatellia bacterium]
MLEKQHRFVQELLRTSSIYWFLAAFWIWITDRALLALIADVAVIYRLQTVKDIFFVTLTAMWVYIQLRNRVGRERHRAETETARLVAIVESSDDAIIGKTLDGTITNWNPAATKLFGYRPEEIIGQDITVLFPPERLSEEKNILARLRRGERLTHYETVQQRKDGSLLPVSLTVSPIKNVHGELIGISKIVRDISDRKRIEADLQESEARFRSVFEQSAMGHLLIEIEQHKIVDCNEIAARRLGYAKNELIGQPITTIDVVKSIEEVEQLRALVATGASVQFETKHRTKTGELRDMLVVSSRLWIRNQAYANVATLDITEQKLMEAALRQERERLEKIALASPSVICSYQIWPDGSAAFPYVNPAFEKICGVRPDTSALAAEIVTDLVHPEDMDSLLDSLSQAATALQPWHHTWRVRTPHRGEIWVEGHFAPALESDHSITWHGILNDVTERKAQEQQLAARERLISAINDATPNIIFLWDVRRGCITYANQAVQKLSGYTPEEVLGKPLKELFSLLHPEDVPRYRTHQKELWRAGLGVVKTQEYRFLHKNGEWRFLQSRDLIFEGDAEGQPTRILSILDDITERKHTLTALSQHTIELQRSNKDLEQFAYVASHDLQEPLRAVAGCVQLLQRRYQGQLDAAADELIQHAVEGVARMQKLIEDLLAYSRLNTKGARWQPTDCEQVLAAACLNLQVALTESQAQITHDPLPLLQADASQLTLLFQNLLSNALKFRSAAPLQIRFCAEQRDQQWLFSVRDNGIGLEPQYAERIFRIFQRLHTRTEYPGTGMGLAICQKIVEQHGGQIWVESSLGKGATFYFTLPIRNDERL